MAPGLQYLVSALSRATGGAEAEATFVVFQVICLVLAILYRHLLHPSKVTPTTRHIVATALGLYIGVYNFSWSICHLLLQSTVAYIIMKVIDPKRSMPQVVFVFAMGYLCVEQLRKALSSDLTSVDHSTSMMIITQRITSLAFSIKDGHTDGSKLNPKQKELAVRRFPTVVEYYSYIFHFQAFLVGPFCFYKHYIDFVEGKDLLAPTNEDGKKLVSFKEPSATSAVLGKLVCVVGIMILVVVLGPDFPIEGNASSEVINSSLVFRAIFLWTSLTLCELRYVIAWVLVDAICNASGLGFNGYHSNGKPKWDLVTNVHYMTFLRATSLKEHVDNWNIGTARWLKCVCYDRVPFLKEMSTFLLSAVWHGFFIGYYWCATTLTLLVLASRKVRRNIRPYFLKSSQRKRVYDWITWFISAFSTAYFTVSFPMITFERNMAFYSSLYFGGHIITILVILILPNTKPVKKTELNSNDMMYETGSGSNGQMQDGRLTAKKDL